MDGNLTLILSLIAGSVDVISFLGLNGLFVSHITGNLVILAVRIVNVKQAPIALIISIPIFVIVLALTKLLVYFLQQKNVKTLTPLLSLHFLFLLSYLIFALIDGKHLSYSSSLGIFAGMLGVAAMAVQNALMQLSLKGLPTTAVMTTNVTRFVLEYMDRFLGTTVERRATASRNARNIWPAIAGFILGCALGAVCQDAFGMRALFLPTGLSLMAIIWALFFSKNA